MACLCDRVQPHPLTGHTNGMEGPRPRRGASYLQQASNRAGANNTRQLLKTSSEQLGAENHSRSYANAQQQPKSKTRAKRQPKSAAGRLGALQHEHPNNQKGAPKQNATGNARRSRRCANGKQKINSNTRAKPQLKSAAGRLGALQHEHPNNQEGAPKQNATATHAAAKAKQTRNHNQTAQQGRDRSEKTTAGRLEALQHEHPNNQEGAPKQNATGNARRSKSYANA